MVSALPTLLHPDGKSVVFIKGGMPPEWPEFYYRLEKCTRTHLPQFIKANKRWCGIASRTGGQLYDVREGSCPIKPRSILVWISDDLDATGPSASKAATRTNLRKRKSEDDEKITPNQLMLPDGGFVSIQGEMPPNIYPEFFYRLKDCRIRHKDPKWCGKVSRFDRKLGPPWEGGCSIKRGDIIEAWKSVIPFPEFTTAKTKSLSTTVFFSKDYLSKQASGLYPPGKPCFFIKNGIIPLDGVPFRYKLRDCDTHKKDLWCGSAELTEGQLSALADGSCAILPESVVTDWNQNREAASLLSDPGKPKTKPKKKRSLWNSAGSAPTSPQAKPSKGFFEKFSFSKAGRSHES